MPGTEAQAAVARTLAQQAALVCAAILSVVAALGLVGGLMGRRILDSQIPVLVPMAPSTAVLFLALALLLALSSPPRLSPTFRRMAALALGVLALLHLAGAFFGRELALLDQGFSRVNAWLGTPHVTMSPATGTLFALCCGAAWCLAAGGPAAVASGLLSGAVVLAASVFLLGYAFGTPLLYGSGVVPMARSTALAFLLLGVGQVCAAGTEQPPLRLFAGPSIKAALLRTFVPLVVAVSIVHSLLLENNAQAVGGGNPLLIAGIAVATAVAVGFVALLASRRVGGALERAEERRAAAEQEVRAALQEKTMLLKELHHRVKNNIQIVNSLLMLQAEYVVDERDRALFEASRKRLSSMAMVHEHLYASSDLSLVDMRSYVERLAEHLLGGARPPVRAQLELEDVRLPIVQCVPCGLLLNELVMNAMKHAFPRAEEPVLRVGLRIDGDEVELAVEDNGPGLPEGFVLAGHASLGMVLVESLARQLRGRMATGGAPGGGARFVLRFPRAVE